MDYWSEGQSGSLIHFHRVAGLLGQRPDWSPFVGPEAVIGSGSGRRARRCQRRGNLSRGCMWSLRGSRRGRARARSCMRKMRKRVNA
jgi:hypothetical protein